MQVNVELGHQAILRERPSDDGSTHDWKVFVRGVKGIDIQNFVEECVFHLHDSYRKPIRVVESPPYEVKECGSDSFIMPIDVFFKGKEELRKVHFEYAVFLSQYQTINNVRTETLHFKNPSDDFRQKLIQAGASNIGGAGKEKDTRQVDHQNADQGQDNTSSQSEAAQPSASLAPQAPSAPQNRGPDQQHTQQQEPDSSSHTAEGELRHAVARSDVDSQAEVLAGSSSDVAGKKHDSTTPLSHSHTGYCGLMIHGFPEQATVSDIRICLFKEYTQFGPVTSIHVIDDKQNLRHAIVSFKCTEIASKALKHTNGKVFLGSPIFVVPHQGFDVNDSDSKPGAKPAVSEYDPNASRTLFVGNFGGEITRDQIREAFQSYGNIIDIFMKKKHTPSGSFNAFAFIEFDSINSVVQAVREMNGQNIGVHKIKTGFGKTNMATNCLLVENIPSDMSKLALKDYFGQVKPVLDILIDCKTSQALVFYKIVDSARMAMKDLKDRQLGESGLKIQVDFAGIACQRLFFGRLKEQEGTSQDTVHNDLEVETINQDVRDVHTADQGCSSSVHVDPPEALPPDVGSTSRGYSPLSCGALSSGRGRDISSRLGPSPTPQHSAPYEDHTRSYQSRSRSRSPLYSNSYRRQYSQRSMSREIERGNIMRPTVPIPQDEFSSDAVYTTPARLKDASDSRLHPPVALLDEYHVNASRTLLIENLDEKCHRGELFEFFERYGCVIGVDMKRRGSVTYAFIEFVDIQSVVKAIKDAEVIEEALELQDSNIKLDFGQTPPSNCVWIGNISDDISEDELLDSFSVYGSVQYSTVDRENGEALVSYETSRTAETAINGMRGCELGRNRTRIQVDFAGPACQSLFSRLRELSGPLVQEQPFPADYTSPLSPEPQARQMDQDDQPGTSRTRPSSRPYTLTQPASLPPLMEPKAVHSLMSLETTDNCPRVDEYPRRPVRSPPPMLMESTSYAHSSLSYESLSPGGSWTRSRSRSPLTGRDHTHSCRQSRDRSIASPETRSYRDRHRSRGDNIPSHSSDVEPSSSAQNPYQDKVNVTSASRTLYVGKVEFGTTAEELRQIFQKYGSIINVDIKPPTTMVNPKTVYAFLEFEEEESVVQAIKEVTGLRIGQSHVKLGFGKTIPSNCVWLNHLSSSVSESMLSEKFSQFGRIKHQYINRSWGQALIFYMSIGAARSAIKCQIPGIKVDYASPACQKRFFTDLKEQGVSSPEHLTSMDINDYDLDSENYDPDEYSTRQQTPSPSRDGYPSHGHGSRSHGSWSVTRTRSMSPMYGSRQRSRSPTHRGHGRSRSPSYRSHARSRSSAYRSKERSRSPAYRSRERSRSPTYRSSHRSRSPTYRSSHRSRSPSYRSSRQRSRSSTYKRGHDQSHSSMDVASTHSLTEHHYDNRTPHTRDHDTDPRQPLEYDNKVSRSVYISNLESDIHSEEISSVFKRFGRIIDMEIRFSRDKQRSCAYVEFAEIQSAAQAIKDMDGQSVRENRVFLESSASETTKCLWLGNIGDKVSDRLLHDACSRFGRHYQVINRENCQALVFYETTAIAQGALENLRGHRIGDSILMADHASSAYQNMFFDEMVRLGLMSPSDRPNLVPPVP